MLEIYLRLRSAMRKVTACFYPQNIRRAARKFLSAQGASPEQWVNTSVRVILEIYLTLRSAMRKVTACFYPQNIRRAARKFLSVQGASPDLPPTNNLVATGTTKKVTTTSKLGSRRSSCIRTAERGINAFPVQSAPSVSGNRRRCSPADSTCQASKVIQILHHTSFLCESDLCEDFATQICFATQECGGRGSS